MNGFLLAAGRGTRLGELTRSIAKPALSVAGLPLMAYSLNLFYRAAVNKLVVNTHHCPDSITQLLEKTIQPWQLKISHEPQLLDTGGGVKNCEDFLRDDTVLLANADIVCDVNITRVIQFHMLHQAELTLVVVPHPHADEIAPITLGKQATVIDINRTFCKKSMGEHLYSGIAIFEPVLFDYLRPEPSSIVYTGYTGMIAARRRVLAYIHDGRWYDCGTPQTLAMAQNAITTDAQYWNTVLTPEVLELRSETH